MSGRGRSGKGKKWSGSKVFHSTDTNEPNANDANSQDYPDYCYACLAEEENWVKNPYVEEPNEDDDEEDEEDPDVPPDEELNEEEEVPDAPPGFDVVALLVEWLKKWLDGLTSQPSGATAALARRLAASSGNACGDCRLTRPKKLARYGIGDALTKIRNERLTNCSKSTSGLNANIQKHLVPRLNMMYGSVPSDTVRLLFEDARDDIESIMHAKGFSAKDVQSTRKALTRAWKRDWKP